ncbi:hypothetical protein KKG71_05790 [Patescibacteria group bacterium]|nr:hypothetical protein [Patescibacteria group bacterium]
MSHRKRKLSPNSESIKYDTNTIVHKEKKIEYYQQKLADAKDELSKTEIQSPGSAAIAEKIEEIANKLRHLQIEQATRTLIFDRRTTKHDIN